MKVQVWLARAILLVSILHKLLECVHHLAAVLLGNFILPRGPIVDVPVITGCVDELVVRVQIFIGHECEVSVCKVATYTERLLSHN